MIKVSQLYCLFTVCKSDLKSNCFLRATGLHISGDMTKNFKLHESSFGDTTSGEINFGRLDRLPE